MTSPTDPALVEMFRAEVDSHMAVLSDGLLALERDPAQPAQFASLMRAAHSIKGAAKVMGLSEAVTIAHEIENSFVAAADGRLIMSSALVDTLLDGLDLLGSATQLDELHTITDLKKRIEAFRTRVTRWNQETDTAGRPASSSADARAQDRRSFTLQPTGALDARWVAEHRPEIAAALQDTTLPLDVDLSRVEALDSIGLALLASLVGRDARSVKLVDPTARWANLLAATGIQTSATGRGKES